MHHTFINKYLKGEIKKKLSCLLGFDRCKNNLRFPNLDLIDLAFNTKHLSYNNREMS